MTVHVDKAECCCVNNGVSPAARWIAVTGVLDRHDVRCCVSTGNGQAEAAVSVRDLDNVALHDGKAPKAGWILVTRELNDFAILIAGSSSRAQAQAAMRIHNCDTPPWDTCGCEYGHSESKSYRCNGDSEDRPYGVFHDKVLLLNQGEYATEQDSIELALDATSCSAVSACCYDSRYVALMDSAVDGRFISYLEIAKAWA